MPDDYRSILKQKNGFILFDGGLHVRGAVLSPEWHSLRKVWLGDFALHRLFPVIEEADFARQISGLAEGARIKIKIVNDPESKI